MKTLSILAASAAAAVCLASPVSAASSRPVQAMEGTGGLLHLAQASSRPRAVPCDQDPNNPNCVQPDQQGGMSGGKRKQPPAPSAEAGQEPAPQTESQPASEPAPEPKPEIEQRQAQPQAEPPADRKPQRVERNRQQEEPVPQRAEKPRRRDTQPPQQVEQFQPQVPQVQRPPRQEQVRPRREPPQDDFAGFLRDNRPAEELTDAELRQRIELFNLALRSGRVDGRQENRMRGALAAYTSELERRITATTGRDVGRIDAGREVRSILSDNRSARRMNDDQLRERIARTRTVLALPGLDPRIEDQLRGLLANDREELRSRIARVERPERREQFGIQPGQQVDRRALRRNMFEARDERRRRLADPDYRIVIPNRPVQRRAPMPTIPLAEAYDEQIMEQLMAPPAYPINRRYTIEEYRANPSLRTLMPGIEVDTVKFGFNEDFLREEEIIKLDRIGEIIERIIAGNPNEVFLIEGHTDLVGSDAYNEDLSWRRAAAVRDALTQFYYIPQRNLEIVGYGEQYPRIPTEFEEPENRRSTIRRITPILYGQR